MTLGEAIEIFKADTSETILNLSELRSEELAEWLEELKARREDRYVGPIGLKEQQYE